MTAVNFYVYFYEDPTTHTMRYVGKGRGNRVKQHGYNIKTNRHLNAMISRLRDDNVCVNPTILECPSENSALAIEVFWVSVFGRLDKGTGTLFNHTDGGDGRSGYSVSPEVRRKISLALSGSKHPAYGKTGEMCPNFGKKRTEEEKIRISRSLSGRTQPPEVVAKRAAANTGKKRTEEQLQRLREGQAKYRARTIKGHHE